MGREDTERGGPAIRSGLWGRHGFAEGSPSATRSPQDSRCHDVVSSSHTRAPLAPLAPRNAPSAPLGSGASNDYLLLKRTKRWWKGQTLGPQGCALQLRAEEQEPPLARAHLGRLLFRHPPISSSCSSSSKLPGPWRKPPPSSQPGESVHGLG